MYFVTYKNILRANKKEDDFMNWLKVYWPQQQKWGATSVKLWNSTEGRQNVLFCQYTVKNIDQWNEKAVSPSARPLVEALDEVVETDKMTIKISIPNHGNA